MPKFERQLRDIYGFKQSQSQFLTPTDGNCGPEGKYLYIYILNSRGFICIHISDFID